MKVIRCLPKILAYLWGFAAETDLCDVICRKHTLFASGRPQSRARPRHADLAAEGASGTRRLRELHAINNAAWPGEACPGAGAKRPKTPAKPWCKRQGGGFRPPPGPSAWLSHHPKRGSSCSSVILKNFPLLERRHIFKWDRMTVKKGACKTRTSQIRWPRRTSASVPGAKVTSWLSQTAFALLSQTGHK